MRGYSSRIKFGTFKITDEIRQSVNDCLDSEWLTIGKRTEEFEEKWRNLFGYKHTRLLSSGTSANTAALMALYELGAEQNDEIIVPALSFAASASSIRAAGFKPVFVDVKRTTLQIDTSKIEEAITPRTKAILAVNLMGRPCDLDVIQEIANRNNLYVILDNCEAYGSKLNNKFGLEYADFETTSHFTAHVTFSVEAGTVSCNDMHSDMLIERIRSHGRPYKSSEWLHDIFGLNFKPSDLHASVGLPDVKKFWELFAIRKTNLYRMREACVGYEDQAYFVEEDGNRINAPHGFSITLKEEGRLPLLKKMLDVENIEYKMNFNGPMSNYGMFKYLGYPQDAFPEADFVGRNGLHVGVHQHLTEDDLDRMTNAFQTFFRYEHVRSAA